MDRRCFSCASKFSIFKKECGCKSCGHSFCGGCLGFSAVLPTYGNTKQKICKKCHDNISSGVGRTSNTFKWSPPENYKKRVAALEAKQSQHKEMQSSPGALHAGTKSRYQGLSPEDQAIAERLEKLKQETKPRMLGTFDLECFSSIVACVEKRGYFELLDLHPSFLTLKKETISSTAEIVSRLEALRNETQTPAPSVQEMEDRLAILQGRMPPSRAVKLMHQPPDNRTQTQKVDDLLTQLKDEVAIDHHSQPQEFMTQPANNLNKADEMDSWTGFNSELDAAQLEKEKDRILKEAAVELRDENTRQEKMLEIAKRLATLQGKDPEKVTMDNCKLPDSDEETEEEAVQRILKQLSEEVVLDEASGYNILPEQSRTMDNRRGMQAGNKPPPTQMATAEIQPARHTAIKPTEPDSDEEELPWCCICNENAALRCLDCDDDLYCKRCFREGHDEFDQKDHRTSEYRPPKKKKGR